MTVVMLRRRKLGRTSCREIARFANHDIKVVRNDKSFPADTSLVIRWGCTSNLPAGAEVLNTAEAIHRVGDKAGFRNVLMNDWRENKAGIGLPLCPHTWQADTFPGNFHDYPLVVRPRVHAQGKHVYLVNNIQEMAVATNKCGPGWYASQFINKVAEYRVFFAQGRVVWVAKKTPGNPDAVAWNVAQGGHFDNVLWGDWPLKAIKISREAFLLSGLHFGGVDVMVDAQGNAFVLEINSAPSQTSPYRQECVAKAFDYILHNGKGDLPVIAGLGDWKKWGHPCLSDQVKMV